MLTNRFRLLPTTLAALALAAGLSACSRADSNPAPAAPAQNTAAAEVRVGYFPNVTHAPALIGVKKDFFKKELGSTKLTTQTFNAGPDEVNALLGNSLDVAFIGSGPAINAFTKSKGTIQLVSGAVSGGAQLVVKPEITSADQLKGKTVATPQLGNTQDVAVKKWLSENKLTDQVKITNLDNPKTLDAFKKGEVDGGWLPEPWASRLVQDAGAKVLVDEKTLWPGGRFPSTVVIVRSEFLQQHPDTVRAIIKGESAAIDWATANQAEAKTTVNDALKELAGSSLSAAVLDRAFGNIELTLDPISAEFGQLAKDSVTAGVVKTPADLKGFADFGPLNEVLKAAGKPAVEAAGLTK
ncbi:NitT/TauT family transport system substrate-binding protein [Amycolatopsis xylanica]|uniref:NitT/TauT family transport system substrate-binding protein n=1 Tax=Amycolatopsis xylanica TaxID=589385 RepID=A0A1H3NCC1_9PSEU|nr:ABC transporter substrate-binding protein [Amycolatopsis xylanica]SDY86105.1 NitT/TauT family transport system substrate-binding protein [Amycolatopsis xylanica]